MPQKTLQTFENVFSCLKVTKTYQKLKFHKNFRKAQLEIFKKKDAALLAELRTDFVSCFFVIVIVIMISAMFTF